MAISKATACKTAESQLTGDRLPDGSEGFVLEAQDANRFWHTYHRQKEAWIHSSESICPACKAYGNESMRLPEEADSNDNGHKSYKIMRAKFDQGEPVEYFTNQSYDIGEVYRDRKCTGIEQIGWVYVPPSITKSGNKLAIVATIAAVAILAAAIFLYFRPVAGMPHYVPFIGMGVGGALGLAVAGYAARRYCCITK